MTILLFWMATGAGAAVYRSVDAQGNVTFSDQPSRDAEKVELPPVPTYPAPAYPNPGVAGTPAAPAEPASYYKRFEIVEPGPEATVRDNPGNVKVRLLVEPRLDDRGGHRIQLYLDGKPVGRPLTGTEAVLPNVDRGEHRLSAALLDHAGRELQRAGPVRFFLHRQSRLFPRGP